MLPRRLRLRRALAGALLPAPNLFRCIFGNAELIGTEGGIVHVRDFIASGSCPPDRSALLAGLRPGTRRTLHRVSISNAETGRNSFAQFSVSNSNDAGAIVSGLICGGCRSKSRSIGCYERWLFWGARGDPLPVYLLIGSFCVYIVIGFRSEISLFKGYPSLIDLVLQSGIRREPRAPRVCSRAGCLCGVRAGV